MANENDFLSSIYGNDLDAFSLTTSTGFYNSEFGSTVASGINPAFIAFFPDLAADSWVTIGIDSPPEPVSHAVNSGSRPHPDATCRLGAGVPGGCSRQNVYQND